MEAVHSEDVADKGAERVLLTSYAGIRNRAVVSPKASLSKAAPKQSRDNSCRARERMPQTVNRQLSLRGQSKSQLRVWR